MKSLATGMAALATMTVLVSGAAVAASAESDPCREWSAEHRSYEADAVRLFLTGASPRALDEALFELLQREAYLTSCEQSVRAARVDLVGWRMVDRPPEEFGSAVVESVLERGGFDVSLESVIGTSFAMPAPPPRRPGPAGRQRAAR